MSATYAQVSRSHVVSFILGMVLSLGMAFCADSSSGGANTASLNGSFEGTWKGVNTPADTSIGTGSATFWVTHTGNTISGYYEGVVPSFTQNGLCTGTASSTSYTMMCMDTNGGCTSINNGTLSGTTLTSTYVSTASCGSSFSGTTVVTKQ